MKRFERRAIKKEFPRPNVDAAYTPNLDSYLVPLIAGIKSPDESLRDVQDKICDISGPLGVMYENLLPLVSAAESGEEVTLENHGVTAFMNCVKKSIILVGDMSAIFTTQRRTKLNPSLASLGKEQFPEAGKQLFGEGFEDKFTNPNNSPPKRQNQKDKEEVSRSTRQSKHISSRIIKIAGDPNFFHSGNFSSPPPLSQPSICQEPGVETVLVLRNYCTSQSSGSTRDSMVEGPSNCWNGRAILRQPIQLTIETDASTKGWGAHCQGISTGGRWSSGEMELHINCLELLAGSLAVKTFANGVGKVHILLLVDSVSAVSYINKLGETHSFVMNSLANDLWTWCLVDMVPCQPCQPHCTTHSGGNQYPSRLGGEGLSGLKRLEAHHW